MLFLPQIEAPCSPSPKFNQLPIAEALPRRLNSCREQNSINSISVNNLRYLHVSHPQFAVAKVIHTGIIPKGDAVVSTLCDSLRRGCNWDTLTRKFDTIELSDSIVDKVLLELKEPTDAKRALGFFHWSALRNKKFEHGVRSYCITIQILVRAGLLVDARALLESVLKKNEGSSTSVVDSLLSSYKLTASDPFVFDLLVRTYAKLRMLHTAFDVCRYLIKHGFSLKLITFNILFHVVQKSSHNLLVWEIYEFMIQNRTYPNEVTIRTMVSALCKEGKLQRFVDVLDRVHGKRCPPMVIVNTSLIFRIVEEGRIEEGMVLLKRMLQKNMIIDTVAFSLVVHATAKLGNIDSAWEVYEEMLKRGFHENSFVYTSFIGAYCREGRIEEASCLIQEMEGKGLKPYGETYDILIVGCAKGGKLEESLRFCEKMMEREIVPSCSAFNEMVANLCETGDLKLANGMLTVLLDKGFIPDEITYSHFIAGYGKVGEVQEVLKLYFEMEYRSLSPGNSVFTLLIGSLCQCGKLEDAEKYLKIMKDRSIAPSSCIYEALIASHYEKGDKKRALQLYKDMISDGLKPSWSNSGGAGAAERLAYIE